MTLLQRANQAMQRGQYQIAVELYDRVIASTPLLAKYIHLNVRIANDRARRRQNSHAFSDDSPQSLSDCGDTSTSDMSENPSLTQRDTSIVIQEWTLDVLRQVNYVNGVLYLKPTVDRHGDTIAIFLFHKLFPVRNGGGARALAMVRYLRSIGLKVILVTKEIEVSQVRAYFDEFDGVLGAVSPKGKTDVGPIDNLTRRYWSGYDETMRLVDSAIRPTVAVVSFAWNAYALRNLSRDTLRIVDTHDVQFLRVPTAVQFGRDLSEKYCTRDEELNALSAADAMIAINEYERAVFQSMHPHTPAIVAQHPADVEVLQRSSKDSREVLFIGNKYDPNTQGIAAFIEVCWHRVLDLEPDAQLNVVGTVAEAIDESKSVRLVGATDDLTYWYARCACVINPVQYGTGFSIKNIEALAHGRHLVCISTFKTQLAPGAPCWFSDLSHMADGVVKALREPDYRWNMERASFEYVEEHYSGQKVFAELGEFIAASVQSPLATK